MSFHFEYHAGSRQAAKDLAARVAPPPVAALVAVMVDGMPPEVAPREAAVSDRGWVYRVRGTGHLPDGSPQTYPVGSAEVSVTPIWVH